MMNMKSYINPRQSLRNIPFPYNKLQNMKTATSEGYFWDQERRQVVALKHYGFENGEAILNPIAWISEETLDRYGFMAFLDWEASLWAKPEIVKK